MTQSRGDNLTPLEVVPVLWELLRGETRSEDGGTKRVYLYWSRCKHPREEKRGYTSIATTRTPIIIIKSYEWSALNVPLARVFYLLGVTPSPCSFTAIRLFKFLLPSASCHGHAAGASGLGARVVSYMNSWIHGTSRYTYSIIKVRWGRFVDHILDSLASHAREL